MATQSLKSQLRQYNRDLDVCLRSRFGMGVRLFKSIKATTQLVGALFGGYAMSLGADPLTALILITVMVSGPEALEYLINEGGPKESE